MYSQANVRAGKVLRPPIRALPSVIVDTEKVLREADGPVGRAALTARFGWKGDCHGVRLESRTFEPGEEPEEHKRCNKNNAYNPFSEESKVVIREMGNVINVRAMRNNSESAMLRMPSLLESRSCLLHLWTSLERK